MTEPVTTDVDSRSPYASVGSGVNITGLSKTFTMGRRSVTALAGTAITAEQLFDLSLLAEVYDANPDLKA